MKQLSYFIKNIEYFALYNEKQQRACVDLYHTCVLKDRLVPCVTRNYDSHFVYRPYDKSDILPLFVSTVY